MSPYSDEVWDSFDGLWRRVQTLASQVRDLEVRLAVLETSRAGEADRNIEAAAGDSEQIKLSSLV